jgi:fructokinase
MTSPSPLVPARGIAAGVQVLVAGDALVDLIVRADGAIDAVPGGSQFNTVRAIARLGVGCGFVGGLSTDRFGRMLEAGLAADRVDLGLVQRTELPTTLALAELGADGSAAYHFYTERTSGPEVLPGPLADGLPASVVALCAGSLGFVLEPMAATLEGLVDRLPATTLFMLDPNARPTITPDPDAWRARMERLFRRADIVKASTEDLAFLRPGVPMRETAEWVAGHGPRVVLVTDGGRPVTVIHDGTTVEVPTPTVEVIDTVGAGDTFGGAFLACLVHAWAGRSTLADPGPVLRAARFAVRASSEVCRRAGANPPSLTDLGGWSEAT